MYGKGRHLAPPFIFDQNIVSGGTAILSEAVSSSQRSLAVGCSALHQCIILVRYETSGGVVCIR